MGIPKRVPLILGNAHIYMDPLDTNTRPKSRCCHRLSRVGIVQESKLDSMSAVTIDEKPNGDYYSTLMEDFTLGIIVMVAIIVVIVMIVIVISVILLVL